MELAENLLPGADFCQSMDPDGFLTFRAEFVFEPGYAGNQIANSTPLVFYNDIPLRFRIFRTPGSERQIRVICALDATTNWIFQCEICHADRSNLHRMLLAPFLQYERPVRVEHDPDRDMYNLWGVRESVEFAVRITDIYSQLINNSLRVFDTTIKDKKLWLSVLGRPREALLFNENIVRLQIHYPTLDRPHPLFRKETYLENYELRVDNVVKDFLDLVHFRPDFKFKDFNRMIDLMNLCVHYSADQCLQECADFLMRTDRIARFDAARLLLKYKKVAEFGRTLMYQANAEADNKFENLDTLEFSPENLSRRVIQHFNCHRHALWGYCMKDYHGSLFGSGKRRSCWFEPNHIRDRRHDPAWRLEVEHRIIDGNFVTSVHSKECSPWFAVLVVYIHVDYENVNLWFKQRIVATPETGSRKFLTALPGFENHPEDKIKIHLDVIQAYLNRLPLSFNFEKELPSYNLKITVKSINKKGKPVEKTFYAIREVLTQCSEYFHACLGENRLNGDPNHLVLHDMSPKMVKTFLTIAFNPRININDYNFLWFLEVCSFLRVGGMLVRLEKYYHGGSIREKTRKAAESRFFAEFPVPNAPFATFYNHYAFRCRGEWLDELPDPDYEVSLADVGSLGLPN